jgi:prepilin-type N-terminal cleavage/methylation domain-containing protein
MKRILKNELGFSMIELLVAISIIGLLVLIILISVENARANGRDAFRKFSFKQVETALELYKHRNGSYPSTGGAWWGESVNGGGRTISGPNAYIPNLTPNYLVELPRDPKGVTTGWSGFLYRSDGTHYKLLLHNSGPESYFGPGQGFYDPRRPTWAWMICDAEPACSSW